MCPSLFLSQPTKEAPKKTTPTQNMRKLTTYVKIWLAKLSSTDMSKMEKEFATSMTDLFQAVWKLDPTTILFPWNDTSSVKPFSHTSQFPTTKPATMAYARNIFLSSGENSWMKVQIGHSKDFSVFELDDFCNMMPSFIAKSYRRKSQPKWDGF